jgi:hypothetical protein
MHTITLEMQMKTPAYFHQLSAENLQRVIADAREVIFSDTTDLDAKKSAGARLYYARETEKKAVA